MGRNMGELSKAEKVKLTRLLGLIFARNVQVQNRINPFNHSIDRKGEVRIGKYEFIFHCVHDGDRIMYVYPKGSTSPVMVVNKTKDEVSERFTDKAIKLLLAEELKQYYR